MTEDNANSLEKDVEHIKTQVDCLVGGMQSLEEKVDTIKTNDLHHLALDMSTQKETTSELKDIVREIKGALSVLNPLVFFLAAAVVTIIIAMFTVLN